MLVAEGVAAFPLARDLGQVCSRPSDRGALDAGKRTSFPWWKPLRREHSELEGQERVSYLRALLRPRVFLLAAVYFCFISGQMGLLFWLPQRDGEFQKN